MSIVRAHAGYGSVDAPPVGGAPTLIQYETFLAPNDTPTTNPSVTLTGVQAGSTIIGVSHHVNWVSSNTFQGVSASPSLGAETMFIEGFNETARHYAYYFGWRNVPANTYVISASWLQNNYPGITAFELDDASMTPVDTGLHIPGAAEDPNFHAPPGGVTGADVFAIAMHGALTVDYEDLGAPWTRISWPVDYDRRIALHYQESATLSADRIPINRGITRPDSVGSVLLLTQ